MKLYYSLLLLFSFSFYCLQGQTENQNITIYSSKGAVIQGTLKGNLFSRVRFKVITEKKTQSISIEKVDSLIFCNESYLVHDFPLKTTLIRIIDSGNVNLFEINGSGLGFSRNSTYIVEVPPKGFNNAIDLLETDQENRKESIKYNDFVSRIIKNNDSIKEPLSLPYDSVINSSNSIIFRISTLRPELGFEIKLTKPISFYNSLGMNFFGNQQRNASSFINYDYSSELRFFYRQRKRSEKGKSNYNFSGPFLAGTFKYFIERNDENRKLIGIILGWQDNSIFKNTYTAYKVGVAYDWNNEEYLILSSLTLGWTLK